ncbi:MAG: aminotransferase class I/II-fold pyridoxal phosphate-dependent enzyme [Saprospiraceae bacterium]
MTYINKFQNLSFDLRYISDLASGVDGCVRSDIGELNYPVPDSIRESIKINADKNQFNYAPTFGDPMLLNAIKEFDKETIDRFRSPKILITSGGQAALFASILTLINPGDGILTDSIYYPPYSNLAKITGAQFDKYRLRFYRPTKILITVK